MEEWRREKRTSRRGLKRVESKEIKCVEEAIVENENENEEQWMWMWNLQHPKNNELFKERMVSESLSLSDGANELVEKLQEKIQPALKAQ